MRAERERQLAEAIEGRRGADRLDASVAVKWIVAEPLRDEALELVRQNDVVVPACFRSRSAARSSPGAPPARNG